MSVQNLRRQLEIVTGLFGYKFGSDALHAWVLDRLPLILASYGVQDIRDLTTAESTFVCKSPECANVGGFDQSSGFDGVPRRRALAGPSDRIRPSTNAACTETTLVSRHWFNKRTNKFLREYPVARIGKDGFAVAGWVSGMLTSANACSFRSTCPTDGIKCVDERGNVNYVTGASFDALEKSILFPTIGDFSEPGEKSDDRKTVQVYVKFTDDGVPYFLIAKRPRSSATATFKQFLTLAVVAASFVIPGLGPTLASSVFGSFAAAYPAVANAIVNVTLQTALNGGDIEAAVERTAAAYIGGQAGSFIEGISDSTALARLTSVATNAAVRGESIEDAVNNAALSLAPAIVSDASGIVKDFIPDAQNLPATGESTVSIFDIPETAPAIYDDYEAPDIEEIASWWDGSQIVPTPGFQGNVPDMAPTIQPMDFSLDDWLSGNVPLTAPPAVYDDVAGDDGSLPDVPVVAPSESFFEGVTWEGTVDKLTDLAIAAIRINQAYQAANRPPVQPAVQTTRAGTTQTARTDGTLTTTDPATGRPVITRPPVGVPYELPGGGAVVNNGNGTYTLVTADGQTVTRQYPVSTPPAGAAVVQPAQWIAGVPNWAVGAAGAGVLALLLMRK